MLKPTGWTSSDVVVKVKHLLKNYTGNKKIKVGHLGTLDPAGSGVLPICFGSATRLFDYMVGQDKVYRATFCFGKTTDIRRNHVENRYVFGIDYAITAKIFAY